MQTETETITKQQRRHPFRYALATLTVSPGRPPITMPAVKRGQVKKSDGLRADYEAILGDWERVGRDIMGAAKVVLANNGN